MRSRKALSLIMSVIMMLTLTAGLNITSYATDYSGSCGESATYTFDDSTGELVISGTGDIDSYAFRYNSFKNDIKSIVINDGITGFKDNAFYDCYMAESISFGNSITSIGDYAFEYFRNLLRVTLPDTVTSIGNYAFSGCDSLLRVTMGSGLKSIGEYAFYECKSLTSITFNDKLESVGQGAFLRCENLKKITLPDSLTSIGDGAFDECNEITEIFIPKNVTSIGTGVFQECRKLESIIVDDENPCYNSQNDCNSIIETATDTLVCGCKNSFIPYGVKIIGARAFDGCFNLAGITIPDSVTSIGDSAFYWCYDLYKIEIPNSVTSIGAYAFDGCGINRITIPKSVTYIGKGAFCSSGIREAIILCEITEIPAYTFRYCYALTEVSIPKSVTLIRNGAFEECGDSDELTTVYYEGSEDDWDNVDILADNYFLKYANKVFNIPMHEHNYKSVVTPATCIQNGYTTHTCTVCGKSYVDSEVWGWDKHSYDSGKIYYSNSTQYGKVFTCKLCGTPNYKTYNKKANTLTAKGKTATVKYSNLKKKKQTVLQKNAFTVTNPQGKVSYLKSSGNGGISVSNAGKITVKKGLKKGTYKVKVKVTAAGTKTVKAKTVTVTVTIKVK